MKKLVEIQGVTVNFYTYEGVVRALSELDLDIYQGETLGLVGETGCGKTMAALSILRLIMPPGKIESGKINFYTNGDIPVNLLAIGENEIRAIRGSQISMVFQEPGAALNPVYTIGDQITEAILLHRRQELASKALVKMDKLLTDDYGIFSQIMKPLRKIQRQLYASISDNPFEMSIFFAPRFIERIPIIRRLLRRLDDEATLIAISLLKEVEIADAYRVLKQYPHQLSGGMKQRACIAISVAMHPKVIIADEPTSALDVDSEELVTETLRALPDDVLVVVIAHRMSTLRHCSRIVVLEGGELTASGTPDVVIETSPYFRRAAESGVLPG